MELPSEYRVGGIAQLGERLNGIQEVSGSIPLISTIVYFGHAFAWPLVFLTPSVKQTTAFRSCLSPPERPEIVRFQVFFRLKSAVFVQYVHVLRGAAEPCFFDGTFRTGVIPESPCHSMDWLYEMSHQPTLGNFSTLQTGGGFSGPLWPVGKALLNRSMASCRMDSCTWR